MADNDERVTIRLPRALRVQIEAHAADLSKLAGVEVSFNAALRKLVTEALARHGTKTKKGAR